MSWLPPDEYVQTIPRATMYGSLYFTDEAGHPLGLRSVERAESWQMPGGNVEHGDATPFATAVRECREETGLAFAGPAVLLLTHYLAPEAAWPCPKIGFVFDGGVLTPDDLARISLDPAEHDTYAVRPLAEWRQVMSPRTFTRLAALHRARANGAPEYLVDAAGQPGRSS